MPIGLSKTYISSFFIHFSPSRIRPSDEINSVYMKSAPFILHKKRKEGSVISSIGARNKGYFPSSIFPIVKLFLLRPDTALCLGRHISFVQFIFSVEIDYAIIFAFGHPFIFRKSAMGVFHLVPYLYYNLICLFPEFIILLRIVKCSFSESFLKIPGFKEVLVSHFHHSYCWICYRTAAFPDAEFFTFNDPFAPADKLILCI